MCACPDVLKGHEPEARFDESGWYHVIKLECNDPTCNHKWTEKLLQTEKSRKI